MNENRQQKNNNNINFGRNVNKTFLDDTFTYDGKKPNTFQLKKKNT